MQSHRLKALGVWITLTAFCATNALAGPNKLADSPLVTGFGKVVSPNIFFILDDSGSMGSEYMPDSVNADNAKACYRNFGYNTIYYNPYYTYDLPLDENGDSYPPASFNNAKTNGFNASSSTTDLGGTTPVYKTTTAIALGVGPILTTNGNKVVTITHGALPDGHVLIAGDQVTLSGITGSGSPARVGNIRVTDLNQTFPITSIVDATHFKINVTASSTNGNGGSGGGSGVKAVYKYQTGTVPNYYYSSYTANPTAPPNSCKGDGTYDDGSYTKVVPSAGNAFEKQNFANWYSYYRTRLLMMKSASGRAFSGVTDKYRVGFSVISDKGITANVSLGVKKFDSTQKAAWYKQLYATNSNSYTPLRGALSKAGRYYAGTLADALAGTDADPVQYACQQNITILTTDGYWNVRDESPSNSGSGGGGTASVVDAATVGAATDNYGPFKMNNVDRVGNQDGALAHPLKDDKNISNTLADVAAYYYLTDLRASGKGGLTDEGDHIDVSKDVVKTSETDPAKYQHMKTFTLGLGVDGNYSAADRPALEQGTKQWYDPISSGEGPARIDDLWHAALNGHGIYFSAKEPKAVEDNLKTVLSTIDAETGAASAAATSNLQPVENGENMAFIAQFESKTWVGDLVAREVKGDTGKIDSTDIWRAKDKLRTQTSVSSDTRSIYTFDGSAANKLRSFESVNLKPEKDAGYFDTSKLSQNSKWDTDQKSAATPEALISYLRGQTGNEQNGTGSTTDLFRVRKDSQTKTKNILGDIASAAPVFVGKPPFAYLDGGYASFIANNVKRTPVVYVGSNDGMLHAFDGTKTGGNELWAYIPTMVIPNLYKLASEDFTDNHKFFVDGPIVVGDAYNGSSWSTILVGGLGHGGRGYYALDVTDPTKPKALWEFDTSDDANLGYSYGNPILTKRSSDGKWVVIFASGYNNATGGGDGKGRLYVVDAFTGAQLAPVGGIVTSSVNDEQRSGIARVSNYVENGLSDNSTQYVYGGDLDGALWRFDITTGTSLLLGRTAAAGTREQPITVQPELAKVRDDAGNWHRVVYFGTGRYLGPDDVTSDPANSQTQSVYAVKDTGTSPAAGVKFRDAAAKLQKQLLDTSVTPRVTKPVEPVDWVNGNGWYVDTPTDSHERFNIDPGLQLGTLVIAANIPIQDYCNNDGSSVLYQLDYKTGKVLKVDTYEAQIVGNTQLQTRGGAGPVVIDPVFGDGTTGNTTQVNGGGGATGVTRVSWREIQ